MLKDYQQQELHSLSSKYKPLYLWGELTTLFLKNSSPATTTFILDSFNKPIMHEKVSQLTGMPLYKTSHDMITYVLDHIYINMLAEKELFFGSNPVSFEVTNENVRPAMNMKFSLGGMFSYLSVGIKQFVWVLDFCFAGKANQFADLVLAKADEFEREIPKINDLSETGKQIEEAMAYVVSVVLVTSVLQQYLKFFLMQKYQYSWDDIAQYYKNKFLDKDLYQQSQQQLVDVAKGTRALDDYMARFGNMGFIDYELSAPTYSEDVMKMKNKITELKDKPERLPPRKIPEFSGFERGLIEAYWLMEAIHGTVRVKSMTTISHLRKLLIAHAKIHNIPASLIFFMRKDELLNKPEAFIKEAEARSIRFMQNVAVELPPLLTEEIITTILLPYTKGGRQHVIPISPGVVTAKIHNLTSVEEPRCEEGCILVLPDGSPTFAPFYDKGVGIIFKKGGSITHGAILARESKIPAVSLGGQDFHLENGMVVSLDGEHGMLEIQ